MMKWLVLFVVILTGLLFVKYPQDYDSQIFKQFWETGHFALFTGLIFTLAQLKRLNNQTLFRLLIATTLFCLSIGLLTEAIQLLIGRSFQIKDIFNDLAGGYTGLLLTRIKRNHSVFLNSSFVISVFFCFVLGTHSLIITIINEWHIRNEFPILSNFETHFELSRWNNYNTNISISNKFKRQGSYSMKVDFLPKRNSRIYLKHFINDWREYKQLVFSLYNETNKPLNIIIKVYDTAHIQSGYQYSDRFNLKTEIQSGWNDFSISLDEIKQAPKQRELNIQTIGSFGVWIKGLKEPVSLYIDDVRLR